MVSTPDWGMTFSAPPPAATPTTAQVVRTMGDTSRPPCPSTWPRTGLMSCGGAGGEAVGRGWA